MTAPLASLKKDLRDQMLGKLRLEPRPLKIKSEKTLKEILEEHFVYREAKAVMVYMALPLELSLDACIESAWQAGKKVAAPRVEGKDLRPCLIHHLDDVEIGSRGIREPKPACQALKPDELDLVLVPGLAFDRLGWRLGRGEGYYDRFLASLPESVYSLGICFKIQLLDSVPYGPNDTCVKEVLAV